MSTPPVLLPERLRALADLIHKDGISGRQFRFNIEKALRDAHAFITLPPTDEDVDRACKAAFETLRAEGPVPGSTEVPLWEEVIQSDDSEDIENVQTLRKMARAMLAAGRG